MSEWNFIHDIFRTIITLYSLTIPLYIFVVSFIVERVGSIEKLPYVIAAFILLVSLSLTYILKEYISYVVSRSRAFLGVDKLPERALFDKALEELGTIRGEAIVTLLKIALLLFFGVPMVFIFILVWFI